MWRRFFLLFILCSSFFCKAQQSTSVSLSDSYFSATFSMATSAAGYFTLTNNGSERVVVTGISVSSTIAKGASLHETIMQDDMVSMRSLHTLSLDAGQTIRFQAGAKHIMLTGLKKPLTEQMTVEVTFLFADHPAVIQAFEVRPAGQSEAMSQHNHH